MKLNNNILTTICVVAVGFLISGSSLAQTTILNNNKLRLGNGGENSVNASGNLQQPFYYNSVQATWRKLTYSVYPLDNAFGVGGDKTSVWNLNGTVVQNPTLSNQVIDRTSFIATTENDGYGTVISTGVINVGGNDLEVQNTYRLPQSIGYVEVKVKVKNVSAVPLENVRIWIGTRDDWVGNTDSPLKEKGNLIDGAFEKISDAATRSAALKISTNAEGILFYTNSDRGNTIVNSCCTWGNIINQNPETSVIEVTNDGSYGFYVRFNDLPVGESDEFTWYYAAGELSEIDNIIREVASVSAAFTNLSSSDGTFVASSTFPATGHWMVVPRGSVAPTAAQIVAGTSYGDVQPTSHGSQDMPANEEVEFQLSGLSAATEYDFYFVTEDSESTFSEVMTAQFATHALPTISDIEDNTSCQDRTSTPVAFTIGDAETAANSLVVSATSSNTALIPDESIVFGGSGANRSISFTPTTGQLGTSTITVTVTDADGDITTDTFVTTITLNDVVSAVVTNLTLLEYAATDLNDQVAGTNLTWYSSADDESGSSTSPADPTAVVGIIEYWVTQTVAGCESPKSKLTLTVLPTVLSVNDSKIVFYPLTSIVDNQLTVIASENLQGASVHIEEGFEPGDDLIVTAALPGEVTYSYNSDTGELSFEGTASAASWQAILRSVRFRTSSENAASRVISFSLGSAEETKILEHNIDGAMMLSKSSVYEEQAIETLVGNFTVVGVDEDLILSYALIAGEGDEGNENFSIGTGTLRTNTVLDYETKSVYSIRVMVTDNFEKSYEQVLLINVDKLNKAPVIADNQSFEVKENSANGIELGIPLVTDPDGTTTFTNWTIVSGNEDGAFAIDPMTGKITVKNNTVLDYERQRTYTLWITVTDGELASTKVAMTINLIDVRENANGNPVIFTSFSPNGDGVNDTWNIPNLNLYPNCEMKLFNSDGIELFYNKGYTRQWDGTYKGKDMPVGTYFYLVRLNDESNTVYKGHITLIR